MKRKMHTKEEFIKLYFKNIERIVEDETLINNIKEAVYCIQFNLERYKENEEEHINYAIRKTIEIINIIDEFEKNLLNESEVN